MTGDLFSIAGTYMVNGIANCTQPAIDDFPRDIFTPEERLRGAVVFHVAASLYLFLALAVVCDKYFVPAVEKICSGKNKLRVGKENSLARLISTKCRRT